MFSDFPLLSALIWLPIFGGGVLLWLGEERGDAARVTALVVSSITFSFHFDLLLI